ncbi:MAG TPA: heme ABC exporter ATP-binding protein CcmA [Trueperaceae bacterium]|nr:heme ABC exporter ATP-binding protein CcmA [Trueperaceae bacterium]
MSRAPNLDVRGSEPEPAPAIRLRALARKMGGEPVLRSIDLDVSPGRVVVLKGSNGAGKTTLLKVLATRLRPSSGGGAVFGNDLIKQANDVRASVGFLGVYGSNYPMLTAHENLVLASSLSSYTAGAASAGAPDNETIEAALTLVGLTDARHKLVRSFSSGMKKRLGLARLVLTDPRLWLLDEPYAALDDEAKSLVDRLVMDARGRGRTVLMASHESDRHDLAPDAVLRLLGGHLSDAGAQAR